MRRDSSSKTIGAQDSVTAFTTSAADQPLVREAHLDDPSKLIGLVNNLKLSDTRSDWRATFKSIDDAINSATFPSKELSSSPTCANPVGRPKSPRPRIAGRSRA
jgi:hypothetical protein